MTTSGRKPPRAVNDGEFPANSADPTSYFDWWPRRGTSEWIEYAFEQPARVSGVEVYWFDDTGRGQVRVPGVGALMSNCDLPRHRSRGVDRWPGSAAWLHVSAGLGTSIFAPVRFACPPEATLLTLVPTA